VACGLVLRKCGEFPSTGTNRKFQTFHSDPETPTKPASNAGFLSLGDRICSNAVRSLRGHNWGHLPDEGGETVAHVGVPRHNINSNTMATPVQLALAGVLHRTICHWQFASAAHHPPAVRQRAWSPLKGRKLECRRRRTAKYRPPAPIRT
jgi:3'-phosphoadenosine 5'-phosphosulfate sulfotransferase (PAPS reductase)/FAD synthetase